MTISSLKYWAIYLNIYLLLDYMEETCNPNGTHVDLTKEGSTYGHVQVVREGGYVY